MSPLPRRRAALAGLALVLAVAATFANALRNGFVFDDYLLIVGNARSRAPLLDTSSLDGYRPLRTLSYRIDFAIGGMHPWIFHLSNVVYHAATVLLVCALLRASTFSLPAAAAGALLFAVHPVQTDAVTYVSGRRDVLCGLFFAAGFLAFLRYRVTRSRTALVGAALCYGGAILSKEMGVTLPVVCLLYDRWQARRAPPAAVSDTRQARRRLWWMVALAAIGFVVFAATYGRIFLRYAGFFRWHGGAVANFATVPRIWTRFLGVVVWPARLSADYSYDAFPLSATPLEPAVIASLVLLLVVAALAVRSWRRGGAFGFAAAWWSVTLLPVSQIVPHRELLAEHYLYIPMIGVAFAFAAAVDAALAAVPRRRAAVAAAVLAIAAAAAARTIVRNRDWRDQLSLWSATVATAPRCARARFNLAQVWFERGDLAAAEREWLAAEAIVPSARTERSLAMLYQRLGKDDLAQAHVEQAFRRRPHDPQTMIVAGWLAMARGEPKRARAYFDDALARLPDYRAAPARVGRARAVEALAQASARGDRETPQPAEQPSPRRDDESLRPAERASPRADRESP